VYIDWKMTRNPMMTAIPVIVSRAMLNPGSLSGVIIDIHSSMVCTG
jgi:hypothetical protein